MFVVIYFHILYGKLNSEMKYENSYLFLMEDHKWPGKVSDKFIHREHIIWEEVGRLRRQLHIGIMVSNGCDRPAYHTAQIELATNTHPNDKAHEFESWFIEDFLRRI